MKDKKNGPETGNRNAKVTVIIESDIHSWLWRERRRRERPIAWLVNQALRQYRKSLERSRDDSDD